MTDLETLRHVLEGRRAARERRRNPSPTHRHGTAVVCPCGVALGGTSVVIESAAETGPCPACGLGSDDDFRAEHETGCTRDERR